jgi:hypothetical protein
MEGLTGVCSGRHGEEFTVGKRRRKSKVTLLSRVIMTQCFKNQVTIIRTSVAQTVQRITQVLLPKKIIIQN